MSDLLFLAALLAGVAALILAAFFAPRPGDPVGIKPLAVSVLVGVLLAGALGLARESGRQVERERATSAGEHKP